MCFVSTSYHNCKLFESCKRNRPGDFFCPNGSMHTDWVIDELLITWQKKYDTPVNSFTLHQSAFNRVESFKIHRSDTNAKKTSNTTFWSDYPWSHNILSLSNWYHWSKLSPPFCLSVCQCRSIAAVTCCCFSPSPSPTTFIPSIAEDQCHPIHTACLNTLLKGAFRGTCHHLQNAILQGWMINKKTYCTLQICMACGRSKEKKPWY